MKNFFWKFIVICVLSLSSLLPTLAIILQVPTPSGQDDIIMSWPTQIQSNESTIFDVIQIINDYLRFAIVWMAMVVLVFGGIKLIVAGDDKDVVATANKMIISSMIAIFVSMLSYALIKLVVNLF